MTVNEDELIILYSGYTEDPHNSTLEKALIDCVSRFGYDRRSFGWRLMPKGVRHEIRVMVFGNNRRKNE